MGSYPPIAHSSPLDDRSESELVQETAVMCSVQSKLLSVANSQTMVRPTIKFENASSSIMMPDVRA
jgi:hypothetical protein